MDALRGVGRIYGCRRLDQGNVADNEDGCDDGDAVAGGFQQDDME